MRNLLGLFAWLSMPMFADPLLARRNGVIVKAVPDVPELVLPRVETISLANLTTERKQLSEREYARRQSRNRMAKASRKRNRPRRKQDADYCFHRNTY